MFSFYLFIILNIRIVQAFCDAYCRFKAFQVDWPGANPDITCHLQSDLYKWIFDGNFPSWAHMVLDEAYTSIGGGKNCLYYNYCITFYMFYL